jgi:glyoxylase-like metal-dependent hydrolase (beta-lactamase superfamily II)
MNAPSRTAGTSVVDDVGWIAGGFVNAYTFREGNETFLIDTGFSRNARPIVRAFEDSRVALSSVTTVLLTHHHFDHMGGAAYLLGNTSAPLACHRDDVPYVTGATRPRMPLLMRLFVRFHPAPVARPLAEGDRVGPLVVVHTPGHTPGEVAFYHPGRKILFSGDSVVERKGRLTLPGVKYAANIEQAVRSLDLLRKLDVDVLLPGHGVPVKKEFGSLLDDLIRRAPTEFLRRPSA